MKPDTSSRWRKAHGSSQRPADLLVHGREEGFSTAIDFSVVHALHSPDNLADVHPGKLARATELRKVRESAALCRTAGWHFCPFVLETIGAWGGRARYLSQTLANRLAIVNQCSRKDAALACRGRVASALLRAVCRQLERGFPEGVAGSGEAPRVDSWTF